MSDRLAKQIFDSLTKAKDLALTVAPGLTNIGHDIAAEGNRMWDLGRSEAAAALFRGDPFVMYGPNQRSAKVEQEHSVFGPHMPNREHWSPEHEQHQHEHSRER